MQADTWYHIRFDFRMAGAPSYMGLSDDSFMMYLNGAKMNEELHLKNIGYPINTVHFNTGWSAAGPDNLLYVDAIGYSWDPNYNVGDNMLEGLLLDLTQNSELNWRGYSLNGQANRTLFGRLIIPYLEEGIHKIQFFGEDSRGVIYESEMRYFTIDYGIEIITPEDRIYSEDQAVCR